MEDKFYEKTVDDCYAGTHDGINTDNTRFRSNQEDNVHNQILHKGRDED